MDRSGDAENSRLRLKIMGYLVSQAIIAVAELGVVEYLTESPLPVEKLAQCCGADPDALRRFLGVLTAEGLFTEGPAGCFAVTPMGELLRADAPGSLRQFAKLMGNEAYHAWGAATHSLRTGQPGFDVVYGQPMFDWLGAHRAASAAFDAAQAELVSQRLQPLLARDWSGISTVVDVGGGRGTLLNQLLTRHQHLRGVLFDQPHVLDADELALSSGVRDRVRLVGGDFFRAVPGGGDVYVLTEVLHDWDDVRAAEILARCRATMAPQAQLLVLEQIVPDENVRHPAKLLDLHMLVLLGGRERGEAQWRRLLTGAGFDVVEVARSMRSALIEARPRG